MSCYFVNGQCGLDLFLYLLWQQSWDKLLTSRMQVMNLTDMTLEKKGCNAKTGSISKPWTLLRSVTDQGPVHLMD